MRSFTPAAIPRTILTVARDVLFVETFLAFRLLALPKATCVQFFSSFSLIAKRHLGGLAEVRKTNQTRALWPSIAVVAIVTLSLGKRLSAKWLP